MMRRYCGRAGRCSVLYEPVLGRTVLAWPAEAMVERSPSWSLIGCVVQVPRRWLQRCRGPAARMSPAEGGMEAGAMQTALPGHNVAGNKGWECAANATWGLTIDARLASAFCDSAVQKARSQERHDGSRGDSSLAGWAAAGLFVKGSLWALRGLCAALIEARTHGLHVRGT